MGVYILSCILSVSCLHPVHILSTSCLHHVYIMSTSCLHTCTYLTCTCTCTCRCTYRVDHMYCVHSIGRCQCMDGIHIHVHTHLHVRTYTHTHTHSYTHTHQRLSCNSISLFIPQGPPTLSLVPLWPTFMSLGQNVSVTIRAPQSQWLTWARWPRH